VHGKSLITEKRARTEIQPCRRSWPGNDQEKIQKSWLENNHDKENEKEPPGK